MMKFVSSKGKKQKNHIHFYIYKCEPPSLRGGGLTCLEEEYGVLLEKNKNKIGKKYHNYYFRQVFFDLLTFKSINKVSLRTIWCEIFETFFKWWTLWATNHAQNMVTWKKCGNVLAKKWQFWKNGKKFQKSTKWRI